MIKKTFRRSIPIAMGLALLVSSGNALASPTVGTPTTPTITAPSLTAPTVTPTLPTLPTLPLPNGATETEIEPLEEVENDPFDIAGLQDLEPLTKFEEQILELEQKVLEYNDKVIDSTLKVEKLNIQVTNSERRAAILKEEVAKAQSEFDFYKELTDDRLRAVQLGSTSKLLTYTEVLLGSDSLIDAFSRATAVNSLMASSQEMTDTLKKKAKELEEKESALKDELANLKEREQAATEENAKMKEDKLKLEEELEKITKLKEAEEARLAAEAVRLTNEAIKAEIARLAKEAREAEIVRTQEQLRLDAVANTRELQAQLDVAGLGDLSADELLDMSKVADASSDKALKVISEAVKYLGTPYVWGGELPSGFDCSGLLQYSFDKALGIKLPRVARDQQKFGQQIPLSEIQPGDLIFMKIPATHVAMYIGNGQYIHAPKPNDVVRISTLRPAYWDTATRVIPPDVKKVEPKKEQVAKKAKDKN